MAIPVLDADHRNAPVLDDATLADLARQFRGELIRAGDPPYDAARRVWNGAIDRRPVLVARCTGVADVRAAVRFARERELVVAVRGGGHNVAGTARSARKGVFTRWAVVARVLFGVTNDGGGVIWVPGQGPIPIGPWTANMEEVTPEVRDMLASLAAFELSGLVEDDVSRTSMRRAAINAIKRNADQLLHQ